MTERFVHRLRVRYSECDAQGIVFNANYFMYFDVALTEFLRRVLGSYRALVEEHGCDLMVVHTSARFHAAARFDDLIDVAYLPRRLGASSLESAIELRRDGRLLTEGHAVHVCIDPATQAKRDVPPGLRAVLDPWVTAPEGA